MGWSDWSSFSPCTADCKKKRQRYCFSSKHEDCPGVSPHGVETQYSSCSMDECYGTLIGFYSPISQPTRSTFILIFLCVSAPIDGHWGRWSSWSRCSKNCSHGYRSRIRTCTDPAPLHGGKYCSGVADEQEDCLLKTTCKPGVFGGLVLLLLTSYDCFLRSFDHLHFMVFLDNCEFTSGTYCHWVSNTKLNYHWQTRKGGTPTRATGPSFDHTTGRG